MSQINNPIEYSISNFVTQIYFQNPRTILFWDTCALLEVIRFPYGNNGSLHTYQVFDNINRLIQSNTIISIASSLTIQEWNNHEEAVKGSFQKSLEKTDTYHSTCLQVANEILGSAYISEPIQNKNLVQSLEALADNILSRTFFLETNEIANNALERVADKRAPASKKNEFKDCAIWETVLKLSRDIYSLDTVTEQIFYTVNTDDFIDKSREPKQFHGSLLSEASLSNLICCQNTNEVSLKL